jgi:predicted dienelactone hydrolase
MRLLPGLGLLTLLAACTNSSSADAPAAGCTRSSDCGTSLVCNQNRCITPGTVPSGGACTASRDCQNGFCDVNSTCAKTGETPVNGACVRDADCGAGLRCELAGFGGTCIPGGEGENGDSCDSNAKCLAGLFCGGGVCEPFAQAYPPFGGVHCQGDPSPFHSFFVVPRSSNSSTFDDPFRLPYPNDIRVSGTTLDTTGFPRPGVTPLGVDVFTLYLQALASSFEGFSGLEPVYFRFNQDIDFTPGGANSINNGGGSPTFVNIDTGDGYGQYLSYHYSDDKYLCSFLTVGTANTDFKPLPPGRYLVYLTTKLHSATGVAPAQDPDLAAVLGATRPTDPDLAKAFDTYKPVRDYLAAHSIAVGTIANAAFFTVGDPTVHMKRLAAAVAQEGVPALSDLFECGVSTGTDACDDGTAARKCGTSSAFIEIHGHIKLPIYQQGTIPYEKTGGALKEANGVVTKDHDEPVCFGLSIPKSAGPWPLVVYSHGTGGSFRSFISDGVAAKMAAAGAATFSFDNVGHGARRGTSQKSPDALVFNVTNPPAARDNFLQGAADILSALKLGGTSPAPMGWTGPALKFGKVAFFGHSQGSTHGELALGYTDVAGAAVVSGAGANLSQSLQNKTSPFNVPATLTFVLGEFNGDDVIVSIWQNYFDRSDPANYGKLIVRAPPAGLHPKNVLMTWGQGDTYAPAATLIVNAKTLDIPAVKPLLENMDDLSSTAISRAVAATVNGVTAAVFQYAPSGYDGHFVAQMNPQAQTDWNAFLTSFFTSGAPVVP